METPHKNHIQEGLRTENCSILQQHTTNNVEKDAIKNSIQLPKQWRRKHLDHSNLTRYLFANKFCSKTKPLVCFISNESGSVGKSVATGIERLPVHSSTGALLGIRIQCHCEASSDTQVGINWSRASETFT